MLGGIVVSSLNISKLIDKRIDVIKAEIGALLFNLGKTHIGFWREKEGKKYFDIDEASFEMEFGYKVFGKYENYYDNKKGIIPFDIDLKWDRLKDFFYKNKIDLDLSSIEEIYLYQLAYGKALDFSKKNILNKIFFTGCENTNSGIDKGAPKNQCNNLWISNAFGGFHQEISFDDKVSQKKVEKRYFDINRISFFLRLNDELSQYINNPDNLTYENWLQIRRFVFKEVKGWYSHLLSDSRFPVNDVTLWDQAYMTASLFKAVIATMLLDENMCKQYETPKNIKWSVLGIQYNKLSLINKSLKAHFISWYNENINACDKEIKEIIEEKYVLGNEIYRDETGIYFIVPENISNIIVNNDFSCSQNESEVKKDLLHVFQKTFAGEIYPSISITKPSRGIMNLAYLIERAKENYLSSSLPKKFGEDLIKEFNNSKFNGICHICGVRPGTIGKDDEDKLILCTQCTGRRESRMIKWIQNQDGETIWTGELQDKNGRIALITLSFELKNWLNGDLLNTLVIDNKDYKTWQDNLEKIKIILTNMHKAFQKFVSGGNKNLSELYKFSTNNKNYINTLLSLFEEKGIKTPYYKVISKILNIYKQSLNDDDSIRFKELFCNEFFGFLNKNWHFINEKNKDNIKYIITDNEGKFVLNVKAREINFDNDRFKQYYDKDWTLLNDIFSFAYIETQINGILLERSVGDRWEVFIKEKLGNKIDFENRKILWHELNDEDIDFLSRLLLQFLLRKNPSPARLRRISETTKGFFEEIQKDMINFMFKDCNDKIDWRGERIVWHVDNLEDYQKNKEYEFKGLEFVTDEYGNVYLISSIEKAIDIIGKTNLKNREGGNEREKVFEAIKTNNFDWIIDKIQVEPMQKNINQDEENKVIELRKENASYKKYLPYISITYPTPTMWQFIVPAEYIPQVIKTVIDKYNRHFKYVIGKLPLHIGIIVQDYKKPLYVGLKALENIRRDICNLDEIKTEINAEELVDLRKSGICCENEHENSETLEDVYSLYEAKNNSAVSVSGRYEFFISPDKKEVVWIDKPDSNEKDKVFYIYPNTFDFEFLDVNTRRNDIFYGEAGKRVNTKKNRPYTWREWDLFTKFFEYFNKENYKAKLQNIISLIYSKLEDWGDDCEDIKKFIISFFINILKLKGDKDNLDKLSRIFGQESWEQLVSMQPDEFKKNLIMFIDMYEFWHKALKKL